MTTEPKVIDKLVSFDEDTSGLIIKHEQHIPDDYLSELRSNKIDPANAKMGDFHLAVSVPTAIVEELMRRYNFDVMREPVRETMKMLRKLHLDLFIQTNKRI